MKLFIDTMVYLHYKQLEDIDLPALLGVKNATVVFSHITIRELDKHKDEHQIIAIRRRARRILSRIEKWIDGDEGSIRANLSAEYFGEHPDREIEANNLNSDRNDDVLIATMLRYKALYPEEEVMLITQDYGPKFTAKRLNIAVSQLPEEYALKVEPNPLEAENKKLKNELVKIKTAQPKLLVGFQGLGEDATHKIYKIKENNKVEEKLDKDKDISALRSSLPKKYPPKAKQSSGSQIARAVALSSTLNCIPQREYDRYNQQLETYFQEVEKYIDRCAAYNSMPLRMVTLKLEIRNRGVVPAEDVDTFIHFPDGFKMYKEGELPDKPLEPSIPQEPMSDIQRTMFGLGHVNIPAFHSAFTPKVKSDSFNLRKTNSYELSLHCDRLKHGHVFKIEPLYIVFPSITEAKSFNFEYRITAANLMDPLTGELHVVIEKE